MKILMIAMGFPPYTFSESLCNGKLVYALQKDGWEIDVISRKDEGPTYSTSWTPPWLDLRDNTYEITYPNGGKFTRHYEILKATIRFRFFPFEGTRWAFHALNKAIEMHKEKHYDVVITRSPNDSAHYVGLLLKKATGIKWIANWNDPASPIWPEPYKLQHSTVKQYLLMSYTSNCLTNADINTFPSESLLRHFKSFFPFLRQKRCEVIPHIALCEEIFPAIANEKHDKFMMCHAGNLSQERNPENLFRAIRELIDDGYADIQLDVMGRINDDTNALIEKYHLFNHVKCVGSFPYFEAIKKMGSYDVLVLVEAILSNGIFFPSKLTDYAQLNKPILAISPDIGFAKELIARLGGGVYADNSDYKKIKEGIKKLYMAWQNETLTSNYSPRKIYEYFSADSVVGQYKQILGNVL